MFRSIRTVMMFVDEPEKAARWWADILEASDVHLDVDGDNVYAWLMVADIEYGFHPASPKRNPQGGSPVVYWSVDDLTTARRRLLDAGCVHHRGPLDVEEGRRICQLTDPFGTVFGLEGP